MSNTPDFGDLRSLLNQHHTPQVWDQLCHWISAFDDEASKQRILPYIEGHLLKWSDQERLAPREWIKSLLGKEKVPWIFIARSISLRGWDRAARRSWRNNTLDLKTFSDRQELEHIHFIDLGHNNMADSELEPLLKSAHLNNLLGLDLQRNELTKASLELLAASPLRLHLKELSLRQNKLGGEGLKMLLARPWPALKKLDLNSVELEDDALELLTSKHLPALEHLDLGKNAFKAASPNALDLPSLHTLILEQCELGEAGAKILGGKRSLSQLSQLSLWSCAINDEGLISLLQRQDMSKLQELNLGKNLLSARAVEVLCQSALPSLKSLNLYSNPLDNQCYLKLSKASWLPQLEQLLLGADQANSTGKKALQKSALLPTNVHLSLS